MRWLLMIAVLLGCASPGQPAQPGGSAGEAPSASPSRQKTIVVVAGAPVKGFGSWNQPTTAGGTLGFMEIPAAGLMTTDAAGNREGRLAARIPSLADDSIAILPDGRMRATWPIRPNVKWHDGTPFSAEDVAFGWEVLAHPSIPKSSLASVSTIVNQIERIEAPDPSTVVITWKAPFYLSNDMALRNLWALPRHLLADAFDGDKEAFLNLPYWTTEFVHLGPFRLVDFGLGENLVFERFDDYFLGRPKVDRIIMRIIQDRNTMLANLQAGAVDIVGSTTLPYELIVDLRNQWASTGDGFVVERRDSAFRSLITQMNPEYARPVEVSRDVRLRRGLFFGLDRRELGAAMLPGAADIVVDSFLDPKDPRFSLAGEPFARYAHDAARASQELADGGWRRGGDGRVLNSLGEPVQVTVRTTGGGGSDKEIAIIAQFWRQLGLDIAEEILPESLSTNLEVRAKFASFETTLVTAGDQTLGRWDSRIAPLPERRYVGNNRGSYTNPALDQVIDALRSTLDEREQGRLLREGGEIVAADLPAMPLYFSIDAAAVRKGVRALADDFAGQTVPGVTMSRNAHLWDRE